MSYNATPTKTKEGTVIGIAVNIYIFYTTFTPRAIVFQSIWTGTSQQHQTGAERHDGRRIESPFFRTYTQPTHHRPWSFRRTLIIWTGSYLPLWFLFFRLHFCPLTGGKFLRIYRDLPASICVSLLSGTKDDPPLLLACLRSSFSTNDVSVWWRRR